MLGKGYLTGQPDEEVGCSVGTVGYLTGQPDEEVSCSVGTVGYLTRTWTAVSAPWVT